jgi:hypothetical protein
VSVGRDIGDFGIVDFGLRAGLTYDDQVQVGISWHTGKGRATTQLLDTEKKVELAIDLLLIRLAYLHPLTPNLSLLAEGAIGSGRFEAEPLADDRNQLGASTQAFIIYRPAFGILWQSDGLSLALSWQVSYAEGEWYDANAYGAEDSDGPPARSDILGQGLELHIGFTL